MSTLDDLNAWLDARAAGQNDPDPEIYSRQVAEELARMKARRDAKRLLDTEDADRTLIPRAIRLDEFLAVPDEEQAYRVDQLWPIGGRALLAAQYKAGKTTFLGNLLRALVDGDPFLDEFRTNPVRDVVLIDNELDERTVRRWLRDQGIRNTQAVRVMSIRGKVSTFNVLDTDVRAQWAAELLGADVILLDCLRPVLDSLGLDENHDAGRFLVAFDALLAECGATEAVVVHHMGHAGERSRGDSRILDWPDATWKLVREKTDDPASPRYFSAFGRDVDVAESGLTFDHETRHLALTGASRKETHAADAVGVIVNMLQKYGATSGNNMEAILMGDDYAKFGLTQKQIRDGRKLAETRGLIRSGKGARNATMWHLVDDQDRPTTTD